MSWKQRRACATVLICCACSTVLRTAVAADYAYTLGYAAEYTDNIQLVPTNTEDELIHMLSAGFLVKQDSREVNASIQARATYRDYQDDTFSDDTTLDLDGIVLWRPLPDVFHLTVEDVYTQVVADPTATDTPANQVDVNVLSAGPDLFWRLTPVHTVQLGGRYAVSTFEATEDTMAAPAIEGDNTRQSATVRWLYRFSPVTTLSLNGLTESVEFDDPANSDFDFRRREGTVGLKSVVARNTVGLEVGATRIKPKNRPEIDGGSGRFSWVRTLASDSSFSLAASRSLSDTAEELLTTLGRTTSFPDTAAVSTSDIFMLKQLGIAYARRSRLHAVEASLFRLERDFETTTANNEESRGVNVEYKYLVSNAFSIPVFVRYVETEFPTIAREDETSTGGLGLEYKISRTLTSALTYTRRSRSSTDPIAEYDENRALLSITYNLPVERR